MSFRILLSKKSEDFLKRLDKAKIGDYRAIYQIRKSELLILVLKIGHRKNAYM